MQRYGALIHLCIFLDAVPAKEIIIRTQITELLQLKVVHEYVYCTIPSKVWKQLQQLSKDQSNSLNLKKILLLVCQNL